jgi:hypothetical protein
MTDCKKRDNRGAMVTGKVREIKKNAADIPGSGTQEPDGERDRYVRLD